MAFKFDVLEFQVTFDLICRSDKYMQVFLSHLKFWDAQHL